MVVMMMILITGVMEMMTWPMEMMEMMTLLMLIMDVMALLSTWPMEIDFFGSRASLISRARKL